MANNQAKLKKDGTRVYSISESKSRKGDIAEYYAVTWLWDNGYEVFKNAGCSGPVDMIALIDVKSNTTRMPRSKEQKDMGVVFLSFEPDTRKLRWVGHKE